MHNKQILVVYSHRNGNIFMSVLTKSQLLMNTGLTTARVIRIPSTPATTRAWEMSYFYVDRCNWNIAQLKRCISLVDLNVNFQNKIYNWKVAIYWSSKKCQGNISPKHGVVNCLTSLTLTLSEEVFSPQSLFYCRGEANEPFHKVQSCSRCGKNLYCDINAFQP